MPTFSSTGTATRSGSRGGVVVEGLDLLVASFVREALTAAPKAGKVTVDNARKCAQRMRDRVPIAEGDLLASITSDPTPHLQGLGVYADAGPDRSEHFGAFKAHLIERGTVKMGPQPFAGPAADDTLPEFVDDIKKLPSL